MRLEDIKEGEFYWLTNDVEYFNSRSGMCATFTGIQQVEVMHAMKGFKSTVMVRIPGARFEVYPKDLKDLNQLNKPEPEAYTSPFDGEPKQCCEEA